MADVALDLAGRPSSRCPECPTALDLAARSDRSACCGYCGIVWVLDDGTTPSREPPAPRRWRPGPPAVDLPLLARWLPELLARSPALVRGTGWTGHNGSTAHANGGRLDHIDESQGYRRAVDVWRYVRLAIASGRGEVIAALWTAHALAPCLTDPRHQLSATHTAVALGAAPRVVREEWRTRSRETDRTRIVESPLVLQVGVDEATGERKYREVIRKSTAILSTRGPSFEALAIVWGAERLGPLWAPSPVPTLLAHAAAMGFAPPEMRAGWERMRGPLKDSAARSWGEARLREAAAEYLENRG